SKADYLSEDAEHLKNYLNNKRQGKMAYLENHFDKRLDPRLLVDDAKSVISVLFNYYSDDKQIDPDAPIISKYAFGKDYHYVIKEKLNQLFDFIKIQDKNLTGRVFVDSAPILERAWAKKSGLGWIGKNGMLINKQIGSFVFIAELIVNLELECDTPINEYCGKCTLCIDACPTNAIIADKVIDGSKCISYLTIEMRGEIPSEFEGKLQDRIFGCDICQDVCPHNSKAKPHEHTGLKPIQKLLEMNKKDWEELDKLQFNKLFKFSPLKRTRFEGLKRNLDFIKEE
ncbi:MAG: tRNA epoxyqueuosine(34) reductase QueG, partial [Bacteroidetes bacterium]